MRRIDGRVWIMAAGLVAGCQPVDVSRPPTIRFGEETCASCRMIIGDEHFAAALVAPTGDALKFDDIGCLVEHEAGRLRPELAYWVRDAVSREWLDAREASFVHSPSVASPMGFGLAAHRAGASAGGPSGRTFRFRELPGVLADRLREAESERPRAE
jgi:copper chaperone NosL